MLLAVYYAILVFLGGLIVGSFLNVCIYRLPEGISVVAPPSACPKCGTKLKPLDLLPVISFMILGGKCRYCKTKVSPIYPLVEITNAFIWLLLYIRFGFSVELFALAFLSSLLIVMFFIDLKFQIIPDELVILGSVAGAFIGVYNYFFHYRLYLSSSWWEPILGAFSSSLVLLVVFVLGTLIYKSDEAMGLGDVKIYIPIGMFLGIQQSLLSLLIAIFLAGFFAIVLLLLKVLNRKSTFAFGPFIAVATIITIFFGHNIITIYNNMLF